MTEFDPKQFEKTKSYNPEISEFKIISIRDDEDTIFIQSNDSKTFSINTNTLLNFLFKNKFDFDLTSISNQFIIDVYNIPRTIDEYIEWEDQKEINTSNEYKKEDLIPGNYYILDDNTKILYLGLRYLVSWKINKDGKLLITKPSKKFLSLEVYDVKDPFIYSSNILDINSGKYKKRTILKEVSGKTEDIDFLLNKFSYELHWLYFKEDKPSFKSLEKKDLDMVEISPENLIKVSEEYDVKSFDLFHFSDNYYLSHNIFITSDFQNNRDYSRQINRSSIFDIELNDIEYNYMNSYSGEALGSELTEKCYINNNYRMAPDNYYFLSIR